MFVICGFPTETQAEFADTIRFLDLHKEYIYAVHRGTFSLEKDAPIFDMPEKFGITKVWLRKDDALGGRWGYECTLGMGQDEAREAFRSVLPFLRVFSPFAQRLGNFRDHALLIYGKGGNLLRPETINPAIN